MITLIRDHPTTLLPRALHIFPLLSLTHTRAQADEMAALAKGEAQAIKLHEEESHLVLAVRGL